MSPSAYVILPGRGGLFGSLSDLLWRNPRLTLLLMLAPIMAQSAPRQPRFDKMVVAILLYLTYTNMVELARVWAVSGTLPAWLGTWWVHAAFVAVVFMAWGRELLAWRRGRQALAQLGIKP